MAQYVRVGDTGTKILATIVDSGVALDISTASTLEMFFTKPSGEVIVRAAAFDTTGVDGKIKYLSIASDFDEVGLWTFEAHVIIGVYDLRSRLSTFYVERVIK